MRNNLFKLLLFLIIVFASFQCNKPKENDFRYKINYIDNDGEILKSKFTDLNYDYDLFSQEGLDSVIWSNETKKKSIGRLIFGLMNKNRKANKVLAFTEDSSDFSPKINEDTFLRFCLNEEFESIQKNNLNCKCQLFDSRVDSTKGVSIFILEYIVMNDLTDDTIGYQTTSLVKRGLKFTNVHFLYDDEIIKDEMKKIIQELDK